MTTMPAGIRAQDQPNSLVHAVDGDGSSFCEQVSAEDMVYPDDLTWDRVPREMRCPDCELLLTAYGMRPG